MTDPEIFLHGSALSGHTHHAPEGGLSLDPYPAVRAWLRRVEALPRFIPMPSSPVPQQAEVRDGVVALPS